MVRSMGGGRVGGGFGGGGFRTTPIYHTSYSGTSGGGNCDCSICILVTFMGSLFVCAFVGLFLGIDTILIDKDLIRASGGNEYICTITDIRNIKQTRFDVYFNINQCDLVQNYQTVPIDEQFSPDWNTIGSYIPCYSTFNNGCISNVVVYKVDQISSFAIGMFSMMSVCAVLPFIMCCCICCYDNYGSILKEYYTRTKKSKKLTVITQQPTSSGSNVVEDNRITPTFQPPPCEPNYQRPSFQPQPVSSLQPSTWHPIYGYSLYVEQSPPAYQLHPDNSSGIDEVDKV